MRVACNIGMRDERCYSQLASGKWQVAVVSGKRPRREWCDNRGTAAREREGQEVARKKAHKSREKCERKKHFDTKAKGGWLAAWLPPVACELREAVR